jgi:hypothetical protein
MQHQVLQAYRFYSYHYNDTRFNDRMEKLRQKELDVQKMTRSEQVLGLRHVENNFSSENHNQYQRYPLQYTLKELRAAYFQAAKQCHPDSQQSQSSNAQQFTSSTVGTSDDTPEERFIVVTNAYEYLRQQLSVVRTKPSGHGSSNNKDEDDDEVLTDKEEEERYRAACFEYLGQPAEIVEESKRCPLFRQWLFGRTDAAYYWQSFFMMHGGLAPQLRIRPPTLQLEQNSNVDAATITLEQRPRRKRPQR